MSQRRTPLLILLACLLTAAGFSLPWAVSAWQDRQTADQVALYETTPLAQADLVAHLKLAANGYHTVALSQASAAYLSESQAGEAAQAALQAMYEKGLFFFGQEDLFAPAQSRQDQRQEKLEQAMDSIRRRFGGRAIAYGGSAAGAVGDPGEGEEQ